MWSKLQADRERYCLLLSWGKSWFGFNPYSCFASADSIFKRYIWITKLSSLFFQTFIYCLLLGSGKKLSVLSMKKTQLWQKIRRRNKVPAEVVKKPPDFRKTFSTHPSGSIFSKATRFPPTSAHILLPKHKSFKRKHFLIQKTQILTQWIMLIHGAISGTWLQFAKKPNLGFNSILNLRDS